MVNTKVSEVNKSEEKVPASSLMNPSNKKIDADLHVEVSPNGSPRTKVESEVEALRIRNKILTDTLKAIKETADKETKKNLELVWFARNRSRYPNHKERKRIEKQHSSELEKLQTPDGDYHHGVHSGCLAASRMFQKQADILHINEHKEVTDELLSVAAQHEKKIEESRKTFPEVAADELM